MRGMERGIQQGMQQGMLQGESTGLGKALSKMLTLEYPWADLTPYMNKIKSVTESMFDEYLARMKSAKSPDEIFNSSEK